jgi:hypothetical protein
MSPAFESVIDRVATELAEFYRVPGTIIFGMAREVVALRVAYDARAQLDLESEVEIVAWLQELDRKVVSATVLISLTDTDVLSAS